METWLAIVVLVLVLLVLAGLVYAYVRASEPGSIRALFVVPATLRETVGSMLVSARDTTVRTAQRTSDVALPRRDRESTNSVTLAYDETALANMRQDLETELRETRERQQQLADKLQRLDLALGEMRSVPDELTTMMRTRDQRTRRQLEQMRFELEGVRRNATAAGTRRDEAYAELYGHIAQIEASLATVMNPMHLPGEPLQVPSDFPPESFEWENWDDVGEHAYAFGMSFNQARMVLDPDLAQDIEQFLATLRQALTGKVYPAVRKGDPTRTQVAQMRAGLESIIESVGPVRRRIEATWHDMDRPVLPVEDADGPEETRDDES